MWENKKSRIAKSIMNNEKTIRDITILDFKLYYRVRLIKTAWYWHKTKHVDQFNLTEDPNINSHIYGYLIFDKEARNTHWKKRKQL